MTEIENPPKQKIKLFASIFRRLIAYVIDTFMINVVATGIMFATLLNQHALSYMIKPIITFVISVIYFSHYDSKNAPRLSLGKRVLEIRVVDAKGEKLSATTAGLRAGLFTGIMAIITVVFEETSQDNTAVAFAGAVLLCISILDVIFPLIQSQNRRLVDLIFSTFVINENSSETLIPAPKLNWKTILFGFAFVILCTAVVFNAVATAKHALQNDPGQQMLKMYDGALLEQGVVSKQLVLPKDSTTAQLLIVADPKTYLDFEKREQMIDFSANILKSELVKNKYDSIEVIMITGRVVVPPDRYAKKIQF